MPRAPAPPPPRRPRRWRPASAPCAPPQPRRGRRCSFPGHGHIGQQPGCSLASRGCGAASSSDSIPTPSPSPGRWTTNRSRCLNGNNSVLAPSDSSFRLCLCTLHDSVQSILFTSVQDSWRRVTRLAWDRQLVSECLRHYNSMHPVRDQIESYRFDRFALHARIKRINACMTNCPVTALWIGFTIGSNRKWITNA